MRLKRLLSPWAPPRVFGAGSPQRPAPRGEEARLLLALVGASGLLVGFGLGILIGGKSPVPALRLLPGLICVASLHVAILAYVFRTKRELRDAIEERTIGRRLLQLSARAQGRRGA